MLGDALLGALVSPFIGSGVYALIERVSRNHPEPVGNPFSDLPFDMRVPIIDVRWSWKTGQLVAYVACDGDTWSSALAAALEPGAGDPGPGRPDRRDKPSGGVGRSPAVEEDSAWGPTLGWHP